MAGGILSWLRGVGKPWLGSWWLGRAREELQRERVAARLGGIATRMSFLPYADSGSGETLAMRQAYRVMVAKEPSVKAAILDKVLSVAALDLSVNPGDDGERDIDQDAAKFGLHLVNRISGGDFGLTGLPAFVEAIILTGLIDGYSVSEKVWAIEPRGRWAGKAILKWVKNKDPGPSGQVDLELDEHNNITAVVGKGPNSGQRWDPAGFVIWRHLSIFDNPAGMSDLRAAYRAYWLIQTSWQFRAIHLEKFTSPMLKGEYASNDQKSELEAALENAKSATWISIPAGAMVEAFELSQKGTADYESAIKDLKHEVFLGISGAILQALEGSTTEGRGSSAIHKSTADIRKWHIRACVESVLNSQVLPDATDLNFAGAAVPVVSLGGIDDGEMASSLAVDQGLQAMGLELSRKDLYKRYGRPEPLDDADAVKPPAPAGPPAPFGDVAPATLPAPIPGIAAAEGEAAAQPFRESGLATSWGDYLGG